MLNIPTLSFCITCKNRFRQISKTLKQNLDDNRLFCHLIEFVLVDFGNEDGLKEWILASFMGELESGYLKYYYTDEQPYWHASIAKNTAHLLASNDIVVNLDCDNYTGPNGGRFLIKCFYQGDKEMFVHQFSGKYYDGSYGRISMAKDIFLRIGGYDESFEPMGGQDDDIMRRLHSIGYRSIHIPDEKYSRAIANSKEDSILWTDSALSWSEMQCKNILASKEKISNGRLVANGGDLKLRYNIINVYDNTTIPR